MDHSAKTGQMAEEAAAHYLCAQGLRVLARNYRIQGGEIDLICQDKDTRVFVEVRLRSSEIFGGAAGSITATKRRRIILAARHWLMRHGDCDCRFDCILINGHGDMEWIRDAFSAD